MGLASALSTALTGLTASETTIDVVGNNLANSNTVGFKSSSANFSTQFLQTLSLGSQPTTSSGGTNPRQVGLGTMVSSISPNFSQGTLEISSNATDLAIQGDGFFIVEGSQGETLYTRNGIFEFNAQNEMVTITGNRLLGFGTDDNFQIQRTTLVPIEIPLGAAAVAQPTGNVFLEGTLTPTGDVATRARQIQTGILGDGTYTAPPGSGSTGNAQQPSVLTVGTASVAGATTFVAGDTYEYRVVWGDDITAGTSYNTESRPSDTFSQTVAANGDSIDLSGLSITPPNPAYTHQRIYRRNATADPTGDFNYVGQLTVGTTTYSDTLADAVAVTNPPLNETLLSGNYSYYVTYVSADGTESRPGPLSTSINVTNGRVTLFDLPAADVATTEWRTRKIYRCLSTDSSTFHLVGEIPNMDAGQFFVDNLTDAQISTNPTIDLDGPKIGYATRLVDMLSRDGSVYNQVFEEGTLEFTGKKGGRSLSTKEFVVTDESTVQDLIDFMDASMGIQSPAADTTFPVPGSEDQVSGSTVSPGGQVVGGRVVLTGNNGVDNAIDVGLSGMLLRTGTTTENVNLPWGVRQEAVGESAVTDFLVYDSLGIPLRVRLTAVLEERNSTSTTYRWFADSPDNDPTTGTEIAVGTGRVTFDGEGNMIAVSESTVSIERRHVSSASPLEFELDFSNMSGLAAENSTVAVSRQDGSAPGVLTSFIVGEDGVIKGVFSNGVTRDLGQIRLARFANPSGLEQKGENLYAEGVNSGLPVEGDPGAQGTGGIISGAVELSNTDIGSNLIDLILASTMYRGNTRVITTAQEMIDELLSLRR
ncbi:MAG: flagellar hook-basal body complex protein [Thermoguttaceae bacterium]